MRARVLIGKKVEVAVGSCGVESVHLIPSIPMKNVLPLQFTNLVPSYPGFQR